MKTRLLRLFTCLLIAFSSIPFQASAFSLRRPDGRIVNLEEEYRWNSRIVTYAFDQRFMEFYGAQGVKDVEAALKILNDLPRASKIVLDDYPLDTRRLNFSAITQNLLDLKSLALGMVVEQLGLGSPTEHVFDEQLPCPTCTPPPQADLEFYSIIHNYDPETLEPSRYVNGILYAPAQWRLGNIFETAVDPLSRTRNAVADQESFFGQYYTGLTRDDVGGLRYLLSRSNVNREPTPGVRGRKALGPERPGVEKITFVRHVFFRQWAKAPAGNPNPTILGLKMVPEPDFLFCADDPFQRGFGGFPRRTNWVNNAAANGNPSNAGPGVIYGPVRITFSTRGTFVFTTQEGTSFFKRGMGSFTDDSHPSVSYPAPRTVREAIVRLPVVQFPSLVVRVPVPYGGTLALQYSSNHVDWATACVLTNTGGTIEWNAHFESTSMTFRAIPFQPEPEENTVGVEVQRPRNQQPIQGGVLPPLPPTSLTPRPGGSSGVQIIWTTHDSSPASAWLSFPNLSHPDPVTVLRTVEQ